MSRHMLSVVVIYLSAGLLIGCGGGSSSSTPPPPTPPQSISGIWTGTVTSTTLAQTSDVVGVVSEAREAVFITSLDSQIHGTLTVSGSSVSGSVTSYAAPGFVFPDGSSVATTSISGTAHTKSSISGTYTGGGDTGTFSLTYSTLYDRTSSLAIISGDWLFIADGTIMTIDQSGRFTFVGNTSGCLFDGQVSVINSQFNAYKVNVTISSCGANDGTYDGLAVLVDNATTNDELRVGVSNGSFSIVGDFARQ